MTLDYDGNNFPDNGHESNLEDVSISELHDYSEPQGNGKHLRNGKKSERIVLPDLFYKLRIKLHYHEKVVKLLTGEDGNVELLDSITRLSNQRSHCK